MPCFRQGAFLHYVSGCGRNTIPATGNSPPSLAVTSTRSSPFREAPIVNPERFLMSDVHSNPEHYPPSPNNLPHPDLATLAVSLQETAQALLTFSATKTEEKPSRPAKPVRDRDGEIRSFYFPPASVNMERELLRKYRAQDFQGLLEEVIPCWSVWLKSCKASIKMSA